MVITSRLHREGRWFKPGCRYFRSFILELLSRKSAGPCGQMDKAPAYEAGDSGFDPQQGLICYNLRYKISFWCAHQKTTTPVRFELTRGNPNRFLVCRLNHSAMVSDVRSVAKTITCSLPQERKEVPGGDRTHNLWIRSPTRYPLRYEDGSMEVYR